MLLIEQIVRDKLIPWSKDATERIIVGNGEMHTSSLPSGVRLEERELKGKRTIVKKRRRYQNTRSTSAQWPDCGINEVNLLKLACVISGAIDFQLGRLSVLCGPGHFIVIPPGMPHPDGTRNITDTRKSAFCELLYFHLFPNALQCWIHRYEADPCPKDARPNFMFQNERLIYQFQIFIEEAIAHPNRLETQETLLQSFIYLLNNNIQDGSYIDTVTGKAAWSRYNKTKEEDFVSELKHYIQSHLQERPTLQTAARAMYLSRTQLARQVRMETGKTYGELVNNQRVETAKVLLLDTDWTIETITKFIGYTTPHYFHIMFRKHTGLTPNNYRKSVKSLVSKEKTR